MHAYLNSKKPEFQITIEHLQKDLGSLRTGRATPALVEDIKVNAYGSVMEIRGLASLNVPDSKTVVIDPWDKSLIQNIEKGIRDAGIGLSPVVDGSVLRIMVPQMTEENRKQIVKIMKEKIEEARIRTRGIREEIREEIMKKEKEKEFSEDEKFKLFDELEKLTKDYNEQITQMGENKEEEIMSV
ncbi:ribosome recycling factor [Candidatus Uhrbacteria bacterium]|nr:ribosome recycling factor [Candidatus Uhrbacteria bacterium]